MLTDKTITLEAQTSLPYETSSSSLDELVEGLPIKEVHRRTINAGKAFAHAGKMLCFWLLEVENRKIYKEYGCSSVYAYAEMYLELAPHTVAEYLRTGKEMKNLPLLAEAFGKGKVSSSKIREISRVATHQTEKHWLNIALSSTYRQVEKFVALTPKGGLPPSRNTSTELTKISGKQENSFEQNDEKSVASAETITNDNLAMPIEKEVNNAVQINQCVGPAKYSTKLVVEFDNDRMAILELALEKARKETGEKGVANLLEHIARAFLDSNSSSNSEGTPYRITLHHVPETNFAWFEGATGTKYVPASTVEEAFCDCEILDLREKPVSNNEEHQNSKDCSLEQSAIENRVSCRKQKSERNSRKGQEKNPAREKEKRSSQGPSVRKSIAPALKRKILERDARRCTTPGCRNTKYLSLHHIVPVKNGGKNCETNIIAVCSRCHSYLHKGLMSLDGNAPFSLVWKNRLGDVLKA